MEVLVTEDKEKLRRVRAVSEHCSRMPSDSRAAGWSPLISLEPWAAHAACPRLALVAHAARLVSVAQAFEVLAPCA